MPLESYYTQKTCKCGRLITIYYERYKIANSDLTDWHIAIAGETHGFDFSGHFRSGKNWPNWVYCNTCQRKHDLTKFRRVKDKGG